MKNEEDKQTEQSTKAYNPKVATQQETDKTSRDMKGNDSKQTEAKNVEAKHQPQEQDGSANEFPKRNSNSSEEKVLNTRI